MEIYKVALFGSREIANVWDMEKRVFQALDPLFRTKPYLQFYVGRNGEFDLHVASLIRRMRKEHGHELCELILMLPYSVADMEYFEAYYDGIIIPDPVYGAHPKQAISLRNKWAVEMADVVMVYAQRKDGGAYRAMQYARSLGRDVFDLSSL